MSWNYRVLVRTDPPIGQAVGEDVYAVHEVYYDDNGQPTSCTEEPSAPQGTTPALLAEELEWFAEALKKPVLKYETFLKSSP